MTVLEAIQKSAEFLTKKNVESPRLQVELLLAHVLRMPRMKLYLNFDRILTSPETDQLRELIKRRGNREPLQHIVGTTSFCGLEIKVSPSVLIPRPETEILAERAWKFLCEVKSSGAGNGNPTALDFGTGSGCIAIALAINCPAAEIFTVDISSEALQVARENAAQHNVSSRLHFLNSDGFAELEKNLAFDLIVANPPYISSAEIATLEPEVRDFDPKLALDGGADGLDFYRRLATQAREFLKSHGKIMLEFGDGQGQAIRNIFQQQQWNVDQIERDDTQRERFLFAQRTI